MKWNGPEEIKEKGRNAGSKRSMQSCILTYSMYSTGFSAEGNVFLRPQYPTAGRRRLEKQFFFSADVYTGAKMGFSDSMAQ